MGNRVTKLSLIEKGNIIYTVGREGGGEVE